jgi:hypothetical protein
MTASGESREILAGFEPARKGTRVDQVSWRPIDLAWQNSNTCESS